MFPVFEIKAFFELTWEDIPFIELPTLGHEHALAALFGRHDFLRVHVPNIDAFKNREVPHFHPHSNYHVIEQQLHYLFYQGHYFSVARHGIPFGATFAWRALETHPDGGEWYIPHRVYGDPLRQKLEDLAKRLGAQKRRMMAEQAEAEAIPAALVAGVRRVVEKREKIEAAPAEVTPQFKRTHEDGYEKDAYTLQADGKPLGAQEGIMPVSAFGLEELPANHDHLVEQGFPNLTAEWQPGRFAKDYVNFSDIRPDVLPSGTKLYRIVDEEAKLAGAYWATELPESKASWRSNYAVKDSWNDNGYYTEYTVPPGDGLKVWRGKTAGQEYREHNGKSFFLAGGEEQIFITPNTITPAPKQFTHWTDEKV